MLVCKYKFDSSIYPDLIPEFNSGYNSYVVTDEVSGNIVVRTIECDTLPAVMRFGQVWVENEVITNKTLSLLEILDMDTSGLTDCGNMFRHCKNLNNVTCDWHTDKVILMIGMFAYCTGLVSLNMSNANTDKVTSVQNMFFGCNNLITLDISNLNMSNVSNNANDTSIFNNTPSLKDIGMVNCDINTINKVGALTTATLWVGEHINIADYTGTAPLKIYKEDKVEIKLNSPLLEGDTIEVKDGKLCHYHKYGMVVLDGSEDEDFSGNLVSDTIMSFSYHTSNARSTVTYKAYCNNFRNIHSTEKTEHFYVEEWNNSNYFAFYVNSLKLSSQNKDGFKIWLQANPTTVVYELASPYYEDITPLQSSIILKTFLESSMIINTNLPIKTNVSYRTNVPSISTLSNRVAEVSESDNVIHNLINIIDDEVDE